MSVQRPQPNCVLCAPSLSAEDHSAIYYAYQESRSYEKAVKEATKRGVKVDIEDIRKHIQYHRPVQPAPRSRPKPEHLVTETKKLPPRLQEMILLVSRVPALSGSQLAEMFYWTGTEKQLASARNACYRDLRRLVLSNFVFKWYPALAVGPKGTRVRASQHRNGFYFLGRDSVPFIAEMEGFEPQRSRDWFLHDGDLPEAHKVFEMHSTAEVVASLARQAKELQAKGSSLEAKEMNVFPRFASYNWFGGKHLNIPLSLPGLQTTHQIGGFATFGFVVPEKKLSIGSPFMIEYDDGVRSLTEVAEHLSRYVDLKTSGALDSVFPTIKGIFPPLLIVTRDTYRLEQLKAKATSLFKGRASSATGLEVFIADQSTAALHGLTRDIWQPLYPEGEKNLTLTDILLERWEENVASGLTAAARITYKAPKHREGT
jgi:hypothetical protein